MKLYEISDKYNQFYKFVEENEDIDPQTITDTLSLIDDEFDEKADAIACFIKNLQAEEIAISEEIKKLEARKKSKKNAFERLKEYLKNQMVIIGRNLIETPRNKLTIKKMHQVSMFQKNL